jgi:hypothetical protein
MMSKLSLTTNVDLQNYSKRIGEIAGKLRPNAIEVFSLPQNYPNKRLLELPESAYTTEGFPQLSRELAKDLGKKLKENSIKSLQFHYPWQNTIMDMNGHNLALTLEAVKAAVDASGVKKASVNYHNVTNYPSMLQTGSQSGETRKALHKTLEGQAVLTQMIKNNVAPGYKIDLVVENNPAYSLFIDKKTGHMHVDNTDLVAEDYIDRQGIDGTTLDCSHAWSVIESFKEGDVEPNLEWCERQYGEIPPSAKSMKNYIQKVAPKLKWLHLSDESRKNNYAHCGLHVGDGDMNLQETLSILNENLTQETPVTIEMNDGHKPEGFARIIENDFPKLKQIISTL